MHEYLRAHLLFATLSSSHAFNQLPPHYSVCSDAGGKGIIRSNAAKYQVL